MHDPADHAVILQLPQLLNQDLLRDRQLGERLWEDYGPSGAATSEWRARRKTKTMTAFFEYMKRRGWVPRLTKAPIFGSPSSMMQRSRNWRAESFPLPKSAVAGRNGRISGVIP